jgi:hypothetical protein
MATATRKLCESFAVGEGDLRAGEVGWEVGGGREEVVGAEGEETVKRFKLIVESSKLTRDRAADDE